MTGETTGPPGEMLQCTPINLPQRLHARAGRTGRLGSPGVWRVKKQPCVFRVLGWAGDSYSQHEGLGQGWSRGSLCLIFVGGGEGQRRASPSTDQLPQRGGKKASRGDAGRREADFRKSGRELGLHSWERLSCNHGGQEAWKCCPVARRARPRASGSDWNEGVDA